MALKLGLGNSKLITQMGTLWQSLTEPTVAIIDEKQRRRARTLSKIMLGSLFIFTFFAILPFFLPRNPINTRPEGTILALGAIFIAYLFSRTRYYLVSMYVYIYVPIPGVAVPVLYNYDLTLSTFVLFSPLISSLLAKPRDTLLSGFIATGAFILLYMLNTPSEFSSQASLTVILITAVTSFTTFGTFIRERNILALERVTDQLRDQITLTRMAREDAEQADKIKSAFLASMSHELRTPLNSIINFTRFIADGDLGEVNQQQKDLLIDVVGSSKHLLALINDVLDMSKIEAGSLRLFVEDDLNIKSLIHGAITTTRGLLNDKPVELKVQIPDDLPLIQGDRQRILQILLNILSNACKFTWDGEIKIQAYQEKDEIIISVADTGPGIALEDQAFVFESFRQTSAGLRQGGGTGLGMPIARNLAEAHGGRLWLESVFGKGATFYVALPLIVNS